MLQLSKKSKGGVLPLLIIATLAFIWIHSAMPGDVSSAESGFVYEFLQPVLKAILPDEWVTELLIRKMAHFCEYALLGVEMAAYMAVRARTGAKRLIAFCAGQRPLMRYTSGHSAALTATSYEASFN